MVDQVLEGDGDTGKLTHLFTICQPLIDLGGAFEGALVIDEDECVQSVLACVSSCEGSPDPLYGSIPRHVRTS